MQRLCQADRQSVVSMAGLEISISDEGICKSQEAPAQHTRSSLRSSPPQNGSPPFTHLPSQERGWGEY